MVEASSKWWLLDLHVDKVITVHFKEGPNYIFIPLGIFGKSQANDLDMESCSNINVEK